MPPLSCPSCKRINHENRWRCLYCGAPLERSADAGVFHQKSKRPGPQNFSIVLLPASAAGGYAPEEISEEARVWLHDHLKIDRFHLDRLLKNRTLQVLRTMSEENVARNIAEHINSFHLQAKVIPNEDLNLLGETFTAKAIDFGESWIFYDPEKGKVRSSPANFVVMVKGKIRVEKIARDSKPQIKTLFNDGERAEVSSAYKTDTNDFAVVDLFSSDEALPPIRLKNSKFDFRCLGESVTHSSEANFQTLLSLITRDIPELYINDQFRFATPILKPTTRVSSDEEEYFAMASEGDGLYHHNEKQFEQFARMVFELFKQGNRL